jgi:hypothetical protein
MQVRGESSRPRMESKVWKRLWQLQAPANVKNFYWRLGNNLLPTKGNLFKRKIATDPLCSICLLELETSYHILWGYPSLVAVWQECSRKIQKLLVAEVEGIDLVQFFWNKLDGADLLEALIDLDEM